MQELQPQNQKANISSSYQLISLVKRFFTLVSIAFMMIFCFLFKKTYAQNRTEFENKCRIVTKLIMVEAFAIFNIYYLDYLRKRKQKFSDTQMFLMETKIQKIKKIISNDVTRECCNQLQISFLDYQKWQKRSKESRKLETIIEKSIEQIRNGKKPSIDYEIHSKLAPALTSTIQQKILCVIRYKTLNLILIASQQDAIKQRKLTEAEKENIIRFIDNHQMTIAKEVMEFYGIVKPGENSLITLKKAYNKYIFDKTWYEDMIKIKDEHYKQMAIIYGYGDKIQLDQDTYQSIKIQDPILSKDPTFGSRLVYQIIKDLETLSQETIDMLTNKYKMQYVKTTKPHLLKLQRIKDKMAFALRSNFQNLQAQDESPVKIKFHGGSTSNKSAGKEDSTSSFNTVQPIKKAQSITMKSSIDAFLANKMRQSTIRKQATQQDKKEPSIKSPDNQLLESNEFSVKASLSSAEGTGKSTRKFQHLAGLKQIPQSIDEYQRHKVDKNVAEEQNEARSPKQGSKIISSLSQKIADELSKILEEDQSQNDSSLKLQ